MRIAGVSMTYNDGYKLKEWVSHYQTYKDQLECFVIVDNGSEKEYKEQLKASFPDAVIIERNTNGGCTAAYNDGIRYVLENTEIEAIAIIGNDIKVTTNCLPELYDYLFSDKQLGIVSSAILFKDSDKIDNYGHVLKGFSVECCNRDESIGMIAEKRKYTDLVSGGFTMAKREFYLTAGLQDEALFMYCDELDTTFKARQYKYKIGVISNEYAWHWHIDDPVKKKRASASRYLISRNRIYLAKKYKGKSTTIKQVFRGGVESPLALSLQAIKCRNKDYFNDAKYSFIGTIHGIIGKMYTNKYTEFDR